MSQTVIDRPPQAPAPAPESALPEYAVSPYLMTLAQPKRSDGLSIAAVICAVVGVGVSCVPLMLNEPAMIVVVGLVGSGLLLGVVAALLGAFGLARAARKSVGMFGLVVGVVSLIWTVGALACNVSNAIR